MREAIISRLKRATESSPRLWAIAWWLMNRLAWILPHDQSYRGLRKLSVPAGSVILDVGANSGISARYFLHLFPNSRVLSLEPNPAHESRLLAIKQRHNRFDFKMVGAGEVEADFTLYTPLYGSTMLHTFSSVDEGQVHSALAKTYCTDQLNRIRIESISCKLVSIDSLNLSPSVIKIDAEGHELQILRGGRDTLKATQPVIVFEASHISLPEIYAELARSDYQVLQYDPSTDRFTFFLAPSVPYFSGARNLYATSRALAFELAGGSRAN